MTAVELLTMQLAGAGKSLNILINEISEENADVKSCEEAMSPREMIEHLCEVYTAVLAKRAGLEHSWGSYAAEDRSVAGLTATFRQLREEAVNACLNAEPPDLETGSHYIVEHDHYHVGQLMTTVLLTVKSFDPYSMYA